MTPSQKSTHEQTSRIQTTFRSTFHCDITEKENEIGVREILLVGNDVTVTYRIRL